MSTQFQAWLSSLGSRRADLPAADRALAVSHTLTYPGNVTTATLRGAIKASPDATAELATFTIGTPVFADGVTTWAISLTAAQTAGLPADGDGDGVETFVFDFLLTLSGQPTARICGGLFVVSGFVTEAV